MGLLGRRILHIADEFRADLSGAGLADFDRLMHSASVGEVIAVEPGREIRRLTIARRGGAGVFFLKRTWPDRRNAKRARWGTAMRRGSMPHEAAWREQEHVRALAAAGLPVMKAAAWGERRVLGVGRESFFLVEGVEGTDLSVVFAQAGAAERRRLLRAIGDLIGRLHVHGFFETVRLRDVFCTTMPVEQSQPAVLVLIDRDTYAPRARHPTPQRCAEEVARGYCKFVQQGHRLSAGELRVFIDGYRPSVERVWPGTRSVLLEAIARDVARLTAPGRKYHGVIDSPALARRRIARPHGAA